MLANDINTEVSGIIPINIAFQDCVDTIATLLMVEHNLPSVSKGCVEHYGIEGLVTSGTQICVNAGQVDLVANLEVDNHVGRDMLTGGQDNDTFVFKTAAEAGNGALADVITDFQVGDKIDLSSIDANLGAGGNQDFALLNQATFTGAGQLIFRHDGGNTIVEGDVDGDSAADFRIDILGVHNLATSDFSGVA